MTTLAPAPVTVEDARNAPTASRRGMTRAARREAIAGYLLIAPNMFMFVIWTLLPVLFIVMLSFTDWNFQTGLGGIKFIGLQNYLDLPSDSWFTDSLRNNLVYTVFTVPVGLALGLLFALILDQQVYLAPVMRMMLFMPYVTSSVAIAAVWLALYHPTRGPINNFLFSLGVKDIPKWFASSQWALPGLMIIAIWGSMGYSAMIYLAGLQGIPDDLHEAAAIDGANGWKRFRYVTLPLLSPTTFFLLITGVIGSFNVFESVAVMTQGGPGSATTVLAYYVYRLGFIFYRMGYAAAVAVILLLIVLAFTLINWRLQKRFTSFLVD